MQAHSVRVNNIVSRDIVKVETKCPGSSVLYVDILWHHSEPWFSSRDTEIIRRKVFVPQTGNISVEGLSQLLVRPMRCTRSWVTCWLFAILRWNTSAPFPFCVHLLFLAIHCHFCLTNASQVPALFGVYGTQCEFFESTKSMFPLSEKNR